MVDQRIQARKEKIANPRQPMQQRSRERREEILKTTATLLERVGFDDLTTILIARELKISVGSLYHYFPNKQAILYALGEHWLAAYSAAVEEIARKKIENLDLTAFSDLCLKRLLRVYKEQKGILPLVQAMYAVPELRDLDDRHDEFVIAAMSEMFRRLGLNQGEPELQRRARLWLEMSHALLLSITDQKPARARRSLADLTLLTTTLIQQK
jgi:AcrR family transcriptional regulator